MSKNPEPKYVYIFGNDKVGFHGHSYDKDDAKNIEKSRKGLKMVKVKNDKHCKETLSINTEFLSCYGDIYVTANEEEFFIESFQQFQDDSIHTIDRLIEQLRYLRFNKKEKQLIEYFVSYLLDYQDFMVRGRYEDIDEDEYEKYDALFNDEAALRWFVENVL